MNTIEFLDKTIHFISTAHVSKASIDEVKETINQVKPEAVCIELDRGRAKNLTSPKKDSNVDIKTIIKQKKVMSFIANLVLSSYQRKIADDLNTEVGQEMKQAITSAKETGARIVYIDRDISITLNRIWGNLGFWRKAELISTLFSTFLSNESVNDQDIEEMKQSDLLYESLKELDQKLPEVSRSILHERNQYMAEMIKRAPEKNIVVVVGAAHTLGIIDALNHDYDLDELRKMPVKKKNSIGSWIIPLSLITLALTLAFKNPSVGLNQLLLWFALSSGLSTLGALLMGSHPWTLLVTLFGAPIGVLNPFLAVGMFSALTEAYFRPPLVSDFDTMSVDASTLKGWFKNKVLRILLIFVVTNLLSSLGTFISGGSMIKNILGM